MADVEKQLHESERQYRSLFENMIDGFALFQAIDNGNGRPTSYIFKEVNSAFEDITGLRKRKIIGHNAAKVLREKIADPRELLNKFSAVALHGKSVRFEHYFQPLGKWLSLSAYSPKPGFFACIVEDISPRKLAEDQVKWDLEEKGVLLKEIHHRVKNNLQVIISLLNLQSRHIEDAKMQNIFRESKNRIYSMALVHEKLYRSQNFSRIDFKEYVFSMSKSLVSAYDISGRVALDITINDIDLEIDTAVSCGLILNELVSNALKYAFPDNKKGRIRIACKAIHKDRFELIVADNGVGLPPGIDLKKADTLGLRLVTILSAQIGGFMCIDNSEGTRFTIHFSTNSV